MGDSSVREEKRDTAKTDPKEKRKKPSKRVPDRPTPGHCRKGKGGKEGGGENDYPTDKFGEKKEERGEGNNILAVSEERSPGDEKDAV